MLSRSFEIPFQSKEKFISCDNLFHLFRVCEQQAICLFLGQVTSNIAMPASYLYFLKSHRAHQHELLRCIERSECLNRSSSNISHITYLLFNQLAMFLQECTKKQAQVLNELLLIIFSICISIFDVDSQRKHLEEKKKSKAVANKFQYLFTNIYQLPSTNNILS